jgi:pimeloyl-ACP methyl ester carboxylesterase
MNLKEDRLEANGLAHHVITWEPDEASRGTFVLCHGFLDLAWSWNAVAERLRSAGYRAIAFDWRGHGESEWIGAGGYYHFADYLLDLDELLPQLAPEPVHLVGHSMGGTACAMFAGLRPERLRSLALVEGLGPVSHPLDAAVDKARRWLRDVAQIRTGSIRVMKSVDEALARMRVQNPDLPDELGRFLASKGTRPGPGGEGLVWRFDPLHRTTSPTLFRPEVFLQFADAITAPTLLVAAERGYRPPDEAERAARIPHAEWVEIGGGVGHMVHWMAPAELSEALLDHVRSGER